MAQQLMIYIMRGAGIILALFFSLTCVADAKELHIEVASAVAAPKDFTAKVEELQPAIINNTEIGKWERFEVAYTNSSWSGNPFDLDFVGEFTHTSSGRTITQLGFYAGNNIWKIFFMPDELGAWTFVTLSSDSDLNNKTGSLNCIQSNLSGRLVGNGNRWQLEDSGQYVAPIMVPTRQWFKSTNTVDGIDDFIMWSKNTAGALIIGTTLVYFNHEQDAVPYIKGEEGDIFNIPMWDRLNSHYDALRDQGMGFYIMFYSDDNESPDLYGITAGSLEEERLFRYAIARFSAYPIMMWDTGIDIGETRRDNWIDAFADWFIANDAWQHPVSSRTSSGSGGKFPVNATYYSDGASSLPSHSTVVSDWQSRSVPTAYTDRWREDGIWGDFDRDKIRQAAWEVGLVGGTAVYVSGNENGGYLTETYASDFKAAPDLGYRDRFFRQYISNFGQLVPHDELVVSGSSVVLAAVPGKEYVAYVGNDNSIILDLSGVSGNILTRVYDPKTGTWLSSQFISGGGNFAFNKPVGVDDWVIHAILLPDFTDFVYLPLVQNP